MSEPELPADKRKRPRPALIMDDYAKIPLGIDAKYGYALVDLDMVCLSNHKWTLSPNGYAMGSFLVDGKRVWVSMHRFIMGMHKKGYVDHINHDRLDNRRTNLRFASNSYNQANSVMRGGTSQYKGVMRIKRVRSKLIWRSRIKVNQKNIYLGYYKTEREAALAYNNAATKYFGEYAHLNNVL